MTQTPLDIAKVSSGCGEMMLRYFYSSKCMYMVIYIPNCIHGYVYLVHRNTFSVMMDIDFIIGNFIEMRNLEKTSIMNDKDILKNLMEWMNYVQFVRITSNHFSRFCIINNTNTTINLILISISGCIDCKLWCIISWDTICIISTI